MPPLGRHILGAGLLLVLARTALSQTYTKCDPTNGKLPSRPPPPNPLTHNSNMPSNARPPKQLLLNRLHHHHKPTHRVDAPLLVQRNLQHPRSSQGRRTGIPAPLRLPPNLHKLPLPLRAHRIRRASRARPRNNKRHDAPLRRPRRARFRIPGDARHSCADRLVREGRHRTLQPFHHPHHHNTYDSIPHLCIRLDSRAGELGDRRSRRSNTASGRLRGEREPVSAEPDEGDCGAMGCGRSGPL